MKIHRVLLLNPPGNHLYRRDGFCAMLATADYYIPQIDFLIQSGYLSEHFDVSVLDANVYGLDEDETIQRISLIKADAIFCLASSISWEEDRRFMERIKREIGAVLVGGGDIFAFEGAQTINNNKFLDAVIIDYVSESLTQFLLGECNDVTPSLIYRKDATIFEGNFTAEPSLIKYPVPRHQLFPLKKYKVPFFKNPGPFTVVYSSHGCPFKCIFCPANFSRLKLREIDNLIEELRYINKIGIKNLCFRDMLFSGNKRHTIDVCQAIIREKLQFDWYCETRVDTVDRHILEIMKKAGCILIWFGVESGDDRILKSVEKEIDIAMIKDTFKACQEIGIQTGAYVIFGLPGDTEESILKTIDFLIELDCDFVSFIIAMPKLGTELRKKAIMQGWISPDYTEMEKGISIPTISQEKIKKLRGYGIRRFYFRPRYITKRMLSIRSATQFLRTVSALPYLLSEMRR